MTRPKTARVRWLVILAVGLSGVAPVPALADPERRIEITPATIALEGRRARQQVAVTIQEDDGTARDLTAEARFRWDSEGVATVAPGGVVTPTADGTTRLRIEAGGLTAEVPVQVRDAQRTPPVSYRLDVVPLLSKAGCNMGPCHGNLNGKGGFKLSLRGDNPAADYLALTRDALGRRIDPARPDSSLVLLKPAGQVAHEGGLRFAVGSPEYQTMRDWIAQGARDDAADAPGVVTLTVRPSNRLVAARGLGQQLVVTATLADGTRRDVTRQSSYDLNDPTIAAVTTEGRVLAKGPSEVAVAVRYRDARATCRLAFLHDRPGFDWSGGEPKNVVDVHVFAKLRALRINPSALAPDAVFLRRAYLDALGVLPTADEARAFLDDPDPHKREKLVDRLLDRPEFADFWALKWADLLRNEEKTMGSKGVWVFQRWLRDQIARDVPMDEFARALIAARGSTWRNPPASFYRTNRDPQSAAEAVGQVFLGVRLQCARCHNHPFDVWTQDDYYGLAAYFANLDRKLLDTSRRDRFDKHEINGDVIVHLSGRPQMVQPRSGAMMHPKPPGGPAPDLGSDPNALDDLANWITRDNPQFARNLANRVWFHLLGRGVVEPVDDFRDSNPPSNPALLDALTAEFVRGGLRLRPLVALVVKSKTYQAGSVPNPTNADDEANFARATVKLLPAEVLLDALSQVLDVPDGFRNAPRDARASQLAGVRMGGDFLQVFGKPDRLLTCECERSESTSLAQAFQLINGESIRAKLEAKDNRVGRLLDAGSSDETILVELYLAALNRLPDDRERAASLDHIRRSEDRRRAWEDVAWAILNSKAFLLRH